MINVYFDYQVEGTQVKLGVYLEDSESKEEIDVNIVTIEGKEGNPASYNYDYALKAFKEAVLTVEEYALDHVMYMNQNRLVFDWVMNDQRDKRVEVGEVIDNLNRVTLRGVDSSYAVIKSKDNLAKKRLRKVRSKKGSNSLSGGSIGLIGESPRAEVKRPKKRGIPVSEMVNRSNQELKRKESRL